MGQACDFDIDGAKERTKKKPKTNNMTKPNINLEETTDLIFIETPFGLKNGNGTQSCTRLWKQSLDFKTDNSFVRNLREQKVPHGFKDSLTLTETAIQFLR
jgi:hypothetical protein